MIEHDNRQKAKALAEFITGDPLRRYLADKVHQYVGENVSVFDGAAGSGQLCQYINPRHLIAVEIQKHACDALRANYPTASVYNQSFFTFDGDKLADCAVMNPPFSLKFKDLSDDEKTAIQRQFPFKKSGAVDDIFVLKALSYSKRWGFFIMYAGCGYRASESHFRKEIGTALVECNVIKNGFDDTAIDVLVVVIDKHKTDKSYKSFMFDCKRGQILADESFEVGEGGDTWQTATVAVQKEQIDIEQINGDMSKTIVDNLKTGLALQYFVMSAFGANIDFRGLISQCQAVIDGYDGRY